MNIGVIGAGTWGIALSRMLSNMGYSVEVWSALKKEIEYYSVNRTHPNLPDTVIPDAIKFTDELETVCRDKDILLFAVPSLYVREVSAKAAEYINNGQIIVDVAKGIEPQTLYTMTQIINDELKKKGVEAKLVALSGPTHAEEVAKDMPTAIVAACEDLSVAEYVQKAFMNGRFRVYTNSDIRGVEFCGAVKNIIAIASGIVSGLGFGDNARAALITRGLSEISRLGVQMGCLEQTFYGLTGIGDLVVTATSIHSRNNTFGKLIGEGMAVKDALSQVGMVVEGINAIPAVLALAHKYDLSLPIIESVNEIVNKGENPLSQVDKLMGRTGKNEIYLFEV